MDVYITESKILFTNIFHTSLVIGNVDFSFGPRGLEITPRKRYNKIHYLGSTSLSFNDVKNIAQEITRATKYNVVQDNCIWFCDEMIKQLGVDRIPPQIRDQVAIVQQRFLAGVTDIVRMTSDVFSAIVAKRD